MGIKWKIETWVKGYGNRANGIKENIVILIPFIIIFFSSSRGCGNVEKRANCAEIGGMWLVGFHHPLDIVGLLCLQAV